MVWDFDTLYVMHVGVAGGRANMQDVCLATDDVHASFGRYIRGATAGRVATLALFLIARTERELLRAR